MRSTTKPAQGRPPLVADSFTLDEKSRRAIEIIERHLPPEMRHGSGNRSAAVRYALVQTAERLSA